MSTRGYMGIQKKGEMKGQYNHFDSYLEGLGKEIIETMLDETGKQLSIYKEQLTQNSMSIHEILTLASII